MDCDVRKQPNGTQLSFQLPQQVCNPVVYPTTAPDGSTVILYGHERGLGSLKLHEGHNLRDSNGQSQELDDEQATQPNLEQWINVDTDSPVTRIAISSVQSSTSPTPEFLRTNVVVLIACANSVLRLITIPLSTNAADKHKEIRITTLHATYHDDLVTSLALSWCLHELRPAQSRSKSRSHDEHLHFLIASASVTGSGLLTYHEVSLSSHLAGDEGSERFLVKRFIQAPLLGSMLEFSHDIRKTVRYPLLLLTSPAHGLVHVLALDETDSSSRKGPVDDHAFAPDGASTGLNLRIVLSVYATYNTAQIPARRKLILDAKWIAHGTGIAAVFEDGEWGVYSIEIADPKSTTRSSKAKIGTLNSFKILGNLNASTQSKKNTGGPVAATIGPVTPHTRKLRSTALFQNESILPNTKTSRRRPVGQIVICNDATGSVSNEGLIFSYDGENLYMPSTRRYLEIDGSSQATGAKSHEKRLQSLPPIRLGGERQLCICTRSTFSERKSSGFLRTTNMRPDLLVLTDSRLILHINNVSSKSALDTSAFQLPLRSIGSKETSFMSRVTRDDVLNIDAMDQILESMESAEDDRQQLFMLPEGTAATAMDANLTPSKSIASGSKLMIEGQQSTARRKLFG